MTVNGASTAPATHLYPAQPDEGAADMMLSEFDGPRVWRPAGELTLVTAGVFLLVALIAWLS